MSINRSNYFEFINERLSTLATMIEQNGKLNVLNLHTHCEYFYRDLLNSLYGWNLVNLNDTKHNNEAIDLICEKNKIISQVSSTCTKQKIEASLDRKIIKDYKEKGYCFKFISISKNAEALRRKTLKNPHSIVFSSLDDVYDLTSILNSIFSLEIENLKKIFEFIKKELAKEVDIEKLDSNLAIIISILSKENLNNLDQLITVDSFEIDRKITFNNLNSARLIIEDYRVHHNRVDKIYSVFDKSGSNKSSSVLDIIRREYIKNIKINDDDRLFFIITENITEVVVQSKNFNKISLDELSLCINILVVDAFIRCKIFKNPENYKYATS